MADTTTITEQDQKKKGQGVKKPKSKQEERMKEGKKSRGKKSSRKKVPPAEAPENSMDITDLDPEGAIGEDKVDNAAHDKLLTSIYAMDGRKRSSSQVRGTGMASSNVDLLVHSKLESTKIKATELNLKSKKMKLVPKPLSIYETEKAKRQIARDVMEKDTKKWEPIVNEIRVAPQIKYAERPRGVEMYEAMKPHKFSPKTPLEIELYEALGKSEDIIKPDQPLTKAEERALKAMSLTEAMARRKELLMHNELLFRSQKEGKRQNKIKSKRYRRGIRMEKMAKTKKSLEEMEKTDPEAYLERLERVDEARMEERLTLRHKSGGKFARYHKAFSKYDDAAREALQEMVRKGKELSQKRHIESSDEEEEEQMLVDSVVSTPAARSEQSGGKTSLSSDLNTKHLEMMKSISKRAGGWLDGASKSQVNDVKDEENNDVCERIPSDSKTSLSDSANETTDSKKRKRRESEISEVGEKDNDLDASTISSPKKEKSQKKKRKVSEAENTPQKDNSGQDGVLGHEKSKKRKQELDESQIENAIKQIRQKLEQDSPDNVKSEAESSSPEKPDKKKRKKEKSKMDTDVDMKAVSDSPLKSTKRKSIPGGVEDVILTPSGEEKLDEKDKDDEDEEEDIPVTMEELFEDEDVVEQFARDKAEEEEKRKPKKEEDVKLPGWGSWSGPDFKDMPKRKPKQRRRKFERTEGKKVDKNANLWLNPNRDKAIRQLQPKTVPFPYTSAEQYAAAIRQPVSRGFVREVAHKILVKPEVVTKLGHIIKPLDKDDFFKDKHATIDVDDGFGKKEIKYSGHVNFKRRDNRLKTLV